MSLLRAFIAIETPPEIQQEIHKKTANLHKLLGPELVRWVPAQNVHLTLKFLGDVSPANLEMLTQMLSVEASQQKPFDLQIGGLGVFPNPRRPRVIWIGIQGPPVLESLQHGLEAATAKLGYPVERRSFNPHLTIGRVRQNISAADQQTIRTALAETRVGPLGTARVESVHLFKSDLKPSGAVYTQIFSAHLESTNQLP